MNREAPRADQPAASPSPAPAGAAAPLSLSADLIAKRDRLLASFDNVSSCVVAFSGGVDSAVVAQAAFLALGNRAEAVMAISPSVAQGEADLAARTAAEIGISFRTLATQETQDERYQANDGQRCYFCKQELYSQLSRLCEDRPQAIVVSGANQDDLGDYRPGLIAAAEAGIRHPLAECEIGKSEVRDLARYWGLSVWDKPAMPCLSSRIAYGEPVTVERLKMIDAAESWLRDQGLRELRVRYHGGDLARIEVPAEALARLIEPQQRDALVARFRQLGFRFVTLDLAGFQSGSLNQLLQIQPAHARSSS